MHTVIDILAAFALLLLFIQIVMVCLGKETGRRYRNVAGSYTGLALLAYFCWHFNDSFVPQFQPAFAALATPVGGNLQAVSNFLGGCLLFSLVFAIGCCLRYGIADKKPEWACWVATVTLLLGYPGYMAFKFVCC